MAFLVLSCNPPEPVDHKVKWADDLTDLPVPWDTMQLNERCIAPEWKRMSLTPLEHATVFERSVAFEGNLPIGGLCGLDRDPILYRTYYHTLSQAIAPSLFFERTIDIPFLRCIVAFEYPWYVTGVLPSMPSYHALSPPKIRMKLFHHDPLIDSLSHDTVATLPFDKEAFRELYKELDHYLQELTGDRSPYQALPYLKEAGCLSPRDYADLLGELVYGHLKACCIQARLKCLPVQPVRTYRKQTYNGAWIWDADKSEYWEDTTVWDVHQFKAKYHRDRNTGDEVIYDVHWEDLAIYVEILFNRFEGQFMGGGDTVGMAPCPRITTTRLPDRQ